VSTRVPASTLRLALAMRGGVSLSVWIGGAVREIEHLRSDVLAPTGGHREPRGAIGEMARAVGYDTIEIDIVSGASAGGLNAVILGAAMTRGKSLDMLRDVWLNSGAIENLLYASSAKTQSSILDGQYFYDELETNLANLFATKSVHQQVTNVDVLLSVTSVVPIRCRRRPTRPHR
jgi:predicted acylesterase/phospholipase RssA